MKLHKSIDQVLDQVIDQAKGSAFETWQAAKKFVNLKSVKLPPELTRNRRELTDKRILSSLKKLGLATKAEVRLLESRIEKLEAQLKGQVKAKKSST
jgi:polyhydroxyalkanoate synthesis regulator phasin